MKLKELKKKSHALKPTVVIGRNGLTNDILKEIKHQLKKNKLIKVQLRQSFFKSQDKKKIAKELAEKTNSVLVRQVGHVVVLADKVLTSN